MNVPIAITVTFDTFNYRCFKFYIAHTVLLETFYVLFTNSLMLSHVLF